MLVGIVLRRTACWQQGPEALPAAKKRVASAHKKCGEEQNFNSSSQARRCCLHRPACSACQHNRHIMHMATSDVQARTLQQQKQKAAVNVPCRSSCCCSCYSSCCTIAVVPHQSITCTSHTIFKAHQAARKLHINKPSLLLRCHTPSTARAYPTCKIHSSRHTKPSSCTLRATARQRAVLM